jgi:hypothetical protein
MILLLESSRTTSPSNAIRLTLQICHRYVDNVAFDGDRQWLIARDAVDHRTDLARPKP